MNKALMTPLILSLHMHCLFMYAICVCKVIKNNKKNNLFAIYYIKIQDNEGIIMPPVAFSSSP